MNGEDDETGGRRRFESESGHRGRERQFGDLASKIIRAGTEAVSQTTEKIRERGEDFHPRDVLSGAAQLGVRGKEELMTIAAKEVRSYLEKLKVGDELRELLTSHSLEVKASFTLKPLEKEASAEPPPKEEAEG